MKIRFSSQSNFGSWVIRKRLGCRWSHVEFFLDDGHTVGSRFFGGVKLRKPIKYKQYRDFEIPNLKLGDIGSWYDYVALLGSLLGIQLQVTKWFQCAEYVAKQLIDNGIQITSNYNLTEPDELYEKLLRWEQTWISE